MDKTAANYVVRRVNANSALVQVSEAGAIGGRPAETGPAGSDLVNTKPDLKTFANFSPLGTVPGAAGYDGDPVTATDLVGDPTKKTGLYALDRIAPEVFNILCVPAAANMSDSEMTTVLAAAATYCEDRRTFLLVDPPRAIDDAATDEKKLAGINTFIVDSASFVPKSRNAAVYFPRLVIPDEAKGSAPRRVGPSGTLAGIYARTDATRGVWKAPAGTDAVARAAGQPRRRRSTTCENGVLNPFGVNCLRTFPRLRDRHLGGPHPAAAPTSRPSEWKYVPVRRTRAVHRGEPRPGR